MKLYLLRVMMFSIQVYFSSTEKSSSVGKKKEHIFFHIVTGRNNSKHISSEHLFFC